MLHYGSKDSQRSGKAKKNHESFTCKEEETTYVESTD